MEQSWALLFDLDQTLVLSKALEPMRKRREWSSISTHFHLTQLPKDTLVFLQRVRPHFHLGVVTSSPRRYAEMLVAHHSLAIPVLAAYHDTRSNHKPDPEPLLFAAKKLDIPPSRCLHVGDDVKDIIATHRAGMVPIGISWDGSLDSISLSDYPHTLCASWHEVLVCLKKTISTTKKG